MVFRKEFCILVSLSLAPVRLAGQKHDHSDSATGMVDMNEAAMSLMTIASGTSVNPASWPMPMLMEHFGNWNTMLMGTGFLVNTQQSGPRGGDKLYATDWIMASA